MVSVIAFDTETALIRPALLAPPLVCVSWQENGSVARLAHHSDAEPIIRGWLESDAILVGHNVAYDMAVICERFPALRALVFKAYDENRVTDTQLRQQLLDIAAGVYRRKVGPKGKRIAQRYDLATTTDRCVGWKLEKDGWRYAYVEFIDVPLSDWLTRAVEVQAEARVKLAKGAPANDVEQLTSLVQSTPEQCLEYPLMDARAALAVFLKQEQFGNYLANQYGQARAAFWLHLSSAWGLKTDEYGVDVLRRETEAQLEEVETELMAVGLVRKDGTRDTKVAKARMIEVCRRDGREIPRTDAHDACVKAANDDYDAADACTEHVSLDADACFESEDQVLIWYAELSTLKKVLSNDVAALAKGVFWPVHTRYGLAETGRTTSSGPNIQNVTKRPGIREAFVPRPGKVFAQVDAPQLELYCLAQCCISWFGFSKLGEALNAGFDPHLVFAAKMLGIAYAEAAAVHADEKHPRYGEVDRARQLAKVCLFGFPGGLGAKTFITYARATYGRKRKAEFLALNLTVERVKELKAQWLEAFPEMAHYFGRINALCANDTNRAFVETLFTKRFRGQATFCAACNNGFQALGSDCMKAVGWLLAKAMYVEWDYHDPDPLFDARTVAFVHDEFIAEVNDDEYAHDAAQRLGDLLVEGANVYLPDVPIPRKKVKPLLMRRWSKEAKPRHDASGRLIPWAA